MASPGRPSGGEGLSWPAVAVLLAATSVVLGVIWDISWHRSIGRDTFWTPAHLAIYLGGVLAGVSCGWLVLRTTFAGTPEARAGSVTFWGFRGPLGAWVSIWGAIAMITSAPFDNWWHNAYGLDVKVLSPPHVLLALGFTGIQLGAMLLLVPQRRYALAFAYAAGLLVCNATIMGFEQIGFPNNAHNALYYKIGAAVFPLLLLAGARASTLKWPATTIAACYMVVTALMVWILPLFPATPKLAPIYNALDHFVPPPFPVLLVVPALGLDLLLQRTRNWNDWVLAAAAGLVCLGLLLATQWFWSEYLVSPASQGWLFGAQRWNYNVRLGPWTNRFWNIEGDPLTLRATAAALVVAALSARVGLAWGTWMSRVRR